MIAHPFHSQASLTPAARILRLRDAAMSLRLVRQVPILGVSDPTGRRECLKGGNHFYCGSALLGLKAAARPGPELDASASFSMSAQEQGPRGLEHRQRPPHA
jgi:hypothetical protein